MLTDTMIVSGSKDLMCQSSELRFLHERIQMYHSNIARSLRNTRWMGFSVPMFAFTDVQCTFGQQQQQQKYLEIAVVSKEHVREPVDSSKKNCLGSGLGAYAARHLSHRLTHLRPGLACVQVQGGVTQIATRPTLLSQAAYSASHHSCTPRACTPCLPAASSPFSTAFWWRHSLPWPFVTAAPSSASSQLPPSSVQSDFRLSPQGSAGMCVFLCS